MTNPAIQNDFSYYRRTLSRNKGVSYIYIYIYIYPNIIFYIVFLNMYISVLFTV